MLTTLHIALNNCPEYIIREAECVLLKLAELSPGSEAIRLKLSHRGMFYRADIHAGCSGRYLSVSSNSRYLDDALEDSYMEISDLLFPFKDLKSDEDSRKVLIRENEGERK